MWEIIHKLYSYVVICGCIQELSFGCSSSACNHVRLWLYCQVGVVDDIEPSGIELVAILAPQLFFDWGVVPHQRAGLQDVVARLVIGTTLALRRVDHAHYLYMCLFKSQCPVLRPNMMVCPRLSSFFIWSFLTLLWYDGKYYFLGNASDAMFPWPHRRSNSSLLIYKK